MGDNDRRMGKNEELFLSCPPKVDSLATSLFRSVQAQGRSQSHSSRWARVPLSSFSLKFPSLFSYFSSNFPHFLSSFWLPGWASRPLGKVLAIKLLFKRLELCETSSSPPALVSPSFSISDPFLILMGDQG